MKQCEISTPSKTLQPVALWNISMSEKATQAQSVAISPQPLALSYAAKHGTPALIKHCFDTTTGRSNYSLTLTFMACVQTSWCLPSACVCLCTQYVLHSIFLRTVTVTQRGHQLNHLLIHTRSIFYIVIDCKNSCCCPMQWLNLFVVMNSYLRRLFSCRALQVPDERHCIIWFVF